MNKNKKEIGVQEEFKDLYKKRKHLTVNIEIEGYTGPLDALYKLVVKHKIEIFEISLVDITNQLVKFVKQYPNVELSGDFLDLTTRLIYLKSASILRKKLEAEKALELQQQEDEIARQLIEKLSVFKKYKEASINIANMMSPTIKSYSRNRPEIIIKDVFDLSTLTKETLYKAILELASLEISKELSEELAAINNGKLQIIYKDKYLTVEHKVFKIENLLKDKDILKFDDIVKNESKMDKVVTFLAILEMTKNKDIYVHQEKAFEELIIEKALNELKEDSEDDNRDR